MESLLVEVSVKDSYVAAAKLLVRKGDSRVSVTTAMGVMGDAGIRYAEEDERVSRGLSA